MNKRTKSFLLSILTLSFIFYSCSNLANDLQKRKNQNLFNITIQETSNGTVTAAKSSAIKAGEEVILTVTATTGYELKTISVTNTQNKDVAVAAMEQGTSYKFTMPASDVTVCTTFDKTGPVDITEPGDLSGANGNTVYRIEHYQQDLDDTNSYTLYAIQKKKGDAGTVTEAVAQNYPGFNSLEIKQKRVAGDGSTVVEVYYDRKTITYTFDPNGGNWDGDTGEKTVSGLYGATVQVENPKKPGYDLTWDKTMPTTFELVNLNFTANWNARNDTIYTVEIYKQNVEGGNNYTIVNSIHKTGTTDTLTNYTATDMTGFNKVPFDQVNINGDESTVIKVYYNRKKFIVSFNTFGGSSVQSQEVLYQAKVSIPDIPEKDYCSFDNWYSDFNFTNLFDFNSTITSNITIYAGWINNSGSEEGTYGFTEYILTLPDETSGSYGTDGEYVLFGDYPQSKKAENVSVDETKSIQRGNMTCFEGSDKHLYVKYNGEYFKVEPIKWRIISKDYSTNNVVLLAENILSFQIFGTGYNDFLHYYLNNEFLFNAFTETAINSIESTQVSSDSYVVGIWFFPPAGENLENYRSYKYDDFYGGWMVSNTGYLDDTVDKIYLLSLEEIWNYMKYTPCDRKVTDYSYEDYVVKNRNTPTDRHSIEYWTSRSSIYDEDGNSTRCAIIDIDGVPDPYGEESQWHQYTIYGVLPALTIHMDVIN